MIMTDIGWGISVEVEHGRVGLTFENRTYFLPQNAVLPLIYALEGALDRLSTPATVEQVIANALDEKLAQMMLFVEGS